MNVFIDSVLRGLIAYRIIIYIVLTLGILIYLRKFFQSIREWQKSVFGLEKKMAQRKLISASTGFTILIILMIGEFLIVTILRPQMPVEVQESVPTYDPLAEPTATLSEEELGAIVFQPTPTIGQDMLVSECVTGILEITSPKEGEEVSGTVEILGSVNVENFGSYKYEYSTTGPINWVTIAAGNQLRLDESLGFWFTSELISGTYLLQLVPLNNIGEELAPCIISVQVVSEE